MPSFLLYVLIALNLLSFTLFGLDKGFAKRHTRRIPEKTLLWAAALGGSVGALLGMLLFRHKTRHLKFTLGIPAILAAELLLWYFLPRLF